MEIKIYKIRDFICLTKSGVIDLEKSKLIVKDLAKAGMFHPNNHILTDLRDTTVSVNDTGEILELVLEIANYKSVFKNKIANLIPDDPERISLAKTFKAAMKLKNFDYDYFIRYEDAIDWLSETTGIGNN